jgi:hypothetical protein
MSEEDIGQAAGDYLKLLMALRQDRVPAAEMRSCEYLNDVLDKIKEE